MDLTWLFFDFGGTIDLYPWRPEGERAACGRMKGILESAGASLGHLDEDGFHSLILNGIGRYYGWRRGGTVELPPERIFGEFVLDGTGIPEEIVHAVAEELAFTMEDGFYVREARPEAREALESLRSQGFKAGIISNTISRTHVPRILKRYGLDDCFEFVVLSSVEGIRKPHRGIFSRAFDIAGVEPCRVAFVGNSPSKDIRGAREAGVGKTVLIEYAATSPDDTGLPADFTIRDLRELTLLFGA